MKALLCTDCFDLVALDTSARFCKCGKCAARWEDPYKGTAIYAEKGDACKNCWGIGIHNHLLIMDSYDSWKLADGYLFKEKQSMIVKFKPGTTNDTRWTSIQEVLNENKEERNNK